MSWVQKLEKEAGNGVLFLLTINSEQLLFRANFDKLELFLGDKDSGLIRLENYAEIITKSPFSQELIDALNALGLNVE